MYLLLWSREEKKIECWSTVPKINKPILHGRFLARSNGLGSQLHDRSQLAGLIPSPLYFPLESPGDIVRRCQHCHWLILQSRREREKKLPEKTKIKEKMRKRISRVPDSFHHINSCHFPGWENGLDEWQEFCRSYPEVYRYLLIVKIQLYNSCDSNLIYQDTKTDNFSYDSLFQNFIFGSKEVSSVTQEEPINAAPLW